MCADSSTDIMKAHFSWHLLSLFKQPFALFLAIFDFFLQLLGPFGTLFCCTFWYSSGSDSSHCDCIYEGLFLASAQGTELLPRHFWAVVTVRVVTVIVVTVIVVTVTGRNMT